METIFREKALIYDIGGGLRVDEKKNNRSSRRDEWLLKLITKDNYKVIDKVSDFNPDVVADIHSLPFPESSIDAILCMAVLEHVEEPQKAVREIYRVLKPGGYCYIYVPFLYYYHPLKGYYGDFYRFTYEGLEYMTKDFKKVEIKNVRGALATVMNLFPFFSKQTGFFEFLDKILGKENSRQTSGYNIFCIK